MLLQVVLLIVGLVVLYFGAEFMVEGATRLAVALGISPMIVGLTVVAFGTSAPEFLVSFVATYGGEEGISVGNIIGSNICNLTLILGSASMVASMAISSRVLKREYPIMLVASLLFFALAYTDARIARWEGSILFIGILAFVGYQLYQVILLRRRFKNADEESEKKMMEEIGGEEVDVDPEELKGNKEMALNVARLIGGLIGLAVGAELMVRSSVTIAEYFEIPSFVIGSTIIAFGTSLPELATTVIAAWKGESDIGVGNIFGSNIFNTLFIMGAVPGMFGMEVEARALDIDFPLMLFVTVLVFPLMRARYKITRLEGGILLAFYVLYTASLIIWPNGFTPGA